MTNPSVGGQKIIRIAVVLGLIAAVTFLYDKVVSVNATTSRWPICLSSSGSPRFGAFGKRVPLQSLR
jgi:hypothetical protein